jgi:tRNA A37 threonylcarbamoyladenosine modification protein TsaB
VALPGLPVRAGLWPRAAEIAQLAVAQVRAGRTVTPAEALPVYLRDDVARPVDPGPASH